MRQYETTRLLLSTGNMSFLIYLFINFLIGCSNLFPRNLDHWAPNHDHSHLDYIY